jgi:hypothetical protein
MAKAKGKTPGSGRKKGTPNKKTADLVDKANELGVDPFEILLLFAKGDWKTLKYPAETFRKESAGGVVNIEYYIAPELRANCASRACEYLHPKRKAVEHSGKIEGESLAKQLMDAISEDEN